VTSSSLADAKNIIGQLHNTAKPHPTFSPHMDKLLTQFRNDPLYKELEQELVGLFNETKGVLPNVDFCEVAKSCAIDDVLTTVGARFNGRRAANLASYLTKVKYNRTLTKPQKSVSLHVV